MAEDTRSDRDVAAGDAEPDGPTSEDRQAGYLSSVVIAAAAGVGLAWTARTGEHALLAAIAVVQALLATSWISTLSMPGRKGGVLIGGLAAAAADTLVMVWPHSRLGPVLAVFGIAVPALFVHQLWRGAARVRVVESLGGIAILVAAEAALAALLQVRHEFPGLSIHTDPAFTVAVTAALAVVAGLFADLVLPAPRFDADVPRGLFAVVVSTAVGAGAAQVALREAAAFAGGRALFLGAAIGAVVGLLAIAVAFVESAVPLADSGFARRSRPVLAALVPLALSMPVALVLCLAVRT